MFEYHILVECYKECSLCLEVRPTGIIQGVRREVRMLDISKCSQCRSCIAACARWTIVDFPIPAASPAGILAEVLP